MLSSPCIPFVFLYFSGSKVRTKEPLRKGIADGRGTKKMELSVFWKWNLPLPRHPLTFCSEGSYT